MIEPGKRVRRAKIDAVLTGIGTLFGIVLTAIFCICLMPITDIWQGLVGATALLRVYASVLNLRSSIKMIRRALLEEETEILREKIRVYKEDTERLKEQARLLNAETYEMTLKLMPSDRATA